MMLRHEITVFMWCALLCPAENGNGTKGIFFRGLLWELNEKKKPHIVRQTGKHMEVPNKH